MVGLLWCLGHAELICGLSEGCLWCSLGNELGESVALVQDVQAHF